MSLLTLELENEADLDLLIAFAKRLNAIILDTNHAKAFEQQSPVSWLEQIAKKGGIKSILQPSEWQREIRTDNYLPKRN